MLFYNEEERKLAEECVHRMVKRAIEMEGTVTVRLLPFLPPPSARQQSRLGIEWPRANSERKSRVSTESDS